VSEDQEREIPDQDHAPKDPFDHVHRGFPFRLCVLKDFFKQKCKNWKEWLKK
jgi:hypothetical protein